MSSNKNVLAVLFVFALVLPDWAQQSDRSEQTSRNSNSQQQQCPEMPGMQMSCPQAQDSHPSGDMQNMDHKQMPGMKMDMNEQPKNFVDEITHHGTSGTSAEPNSTPMPMLMSMKGKWTLMFHGEAFVSAIQQSGPRGTDKVFSTNWFMPMAQRQLGPGTITARVMLSFEPGTVTGRYYPELFQQGETAFGKPIVDGQHPQFFHGISSTL